MAGQIQAAASKKNRNSSYFQIIREVNSEVNSFFESFGNKTRYSTWTNCVGKIEIKFTGADPDLEKHCQNLNIWVVQDMLSDRISPHLPSQNAIKKGQLE